MHANVEDEAPIAPDRRLKRQSRILSWLILLAFSVAALIDLAQVSAFAFRAGSLCGLLNGGFAFVVDFPPFRETTDSLPASFISVSGLALWQSVLAAGLLALRLLPGLVIWAASICCSAPMRAARYSPMATPRISGESPGLCWPMRWCR